MRNILFSFVVLTIVIITTSQGGKAQNQPISGIADRRCAVGGQVTNMLSGLPVKKATIRLDAAGGEADIFASVRMSTIGFGASAGKARYATTSQGDGSFCFETVEAGQYTLSGSRPGFLDTSYGAKSPTESGKSVIVGSQPHDDLTLALVPQSVISGKVIDEDDEPVNGAGVKLLLRTWARGRFRNIPVRGAQSNDLGEFRVADVSPGTYYVVVEPKAENPASSTSGRKSLRTFYPGVTIVAQATPILVQAGEERSGLNIRILAGKVHHVRGKIVGPLSPTDHGFITLLPQDEEQVSISAGSSNYKPDGSFDFPDVAAGTYNLTYLQVSGESAKGGRRLVEVGDQDVNNIALAITTPATIRGRIRIEGDHPQDSRPPNFQSIHLVLTTADAVLGPSAIATILGDGSFEIHDIVPGRYLVRVNALPGAYVKSIRYGQAGAQIDITTKDIDLADSSSGEMDVLFRYGLANINGQIDQAQNGENGVHNVKPAHIVLVPSVFDPDGRGILFGNSDAGNAFSIKQVPPGRYRAYAFESIDFAALHDPAVLKALDSVGTELDLKEGDQKSISLGLISSEEHQHLLSLRESQ